MGTEIMDVVSGFVAITLPIVAAVLLSSRQTQKIIEATGFQTQHILRKLERCLVKIDRAQHGMRKCLLKLDFGFKANALMHGWGRVDGVTKDQVRRLPEPKVYDEELGICYFKPD
jgi:hypothetical protein